MNTTIEILLVEDNPNDAELTIRELKKNNLADNLLHVENGEQALDFIFSRGKYSNRLVDKPPKLILLDIQMPKVNGLEVLQVIKSDPRSKLIPVVMLTSSKEDPDIKKSYEIGANSYIVKPVNFKDFGEYIKNLGIYWLLINQSPH